MNSSALAVRRDSEPLLSIRGLGIAYRSDDRVHEVVADVSFDLGAGEILGLAGESGCGKSTVARASMGWLPPNATASGEVVFRSESLLQASRARLRSLWGRELAYVPQEVSSGLNPSRRVGRQLAEVLELHGNLSKAERLSVIEVALLSVGIEPGRSTLSRYPFEFSGGQQQRISIAMAMLGKPRVLILDEPTTGIDATLRREILDLIRHLLRENGTAAIYISHDLIEVANIADRVAIFYAGRVMDIGPARDVLERPAHPYAKALVRAVPRMNAEKLVEGIPGTPPSGVVHGRCSYARRCPFVIDPCLAGDIPLLGNEDRLVRCIRHQEIEATGQPSDIPAIPSPPNAGDRILAVSSLSCRYSERGLAAVDDVSFDVRPGELVGLVGESGSGKSTLLRTIAGLHSPTAGTILYCGRPLARAFEQRSAGDRQALQLIFQNPERSLNPRRTVAQILLDALVLFRPALSRAEQQATVHELLGKVRMSSALLTRYPHQLSGGEKQRVAIARAFAADPALLLCDEVVSALDVSVQAVIMRLIRDYVETTGAAAIFVSHDLPVVRMMSSKALVLKAGRVCEAGATAEVFTRPSQAYTSRLLMSLP